MSVQGLVAALALAVVGAEAGDSAAPSTEAASTDASRSVAKAGTPIILEIVDPISTRTIKRGDTFALKLAEPVVVEGCTVIPAGSVGFGQVVDVGKPGIGGKPAKLVLAGRRLKVGETEVPIRSFFVGAKGDDASTTSMAVGVAVGFYLGVLVQGGHVVIPAGTLARGKLGQDFGLQPSDTACTGSKLSTENGGDT